MEVDVDGDDSAVGRALRIKIRLDISKPLRRGIMADLGEEKGERWCPIAYEHLPEFCYICGHIGHVDRSCSKTLGKKELAPYGRELRFIPPRKPFVHRTQGSVLSGKQCGSGSWRVGRSESGGSGGKSRSDGPSWRKDPVKEIAKVGGKKVGEEEEVTSPLKLTNSKEAGAEKAKKMLFGAKDRLGREGNNEKEGEVLADNDGIKNRVKVEARGGLDLVLGKRKGEEDGRSWMCRLR